MKTHRIALYAWICLISTSALHAGDSATSGFAKSDNFTVLTPRLETAEEANEFAASVLRTAEALRSEIAQEWFGEELPSRQGRTIVTVSFDAHRDAGLTWAIDDPRRKFHALYLTTSPELVLGSTLAHEMAHVILATRFPHPNRLPSWLEEGIACQYDDDFRQQSRQEQVMAFIRSRRWPQIAEVLQARNIPATDTKAYTVAASVTALLLSRNDDRQRLFAFGQNGCAMGWDAALQKYYGIESVDQLQRIWQHSILN